MKKNKKILIINKSLRKKSFKEFLISLNKSKKKTNTGGTPPTDVYTMH